MKYLVAGVVLLAGMHLAMAQSPMPRAPESSGSYVITNEPVSAGSTTKHEPNYIHGDSIIGDSGCSSCCNSGGLFQSDRAFPNFIGPISNPILSKDPRSQTEARFLFVNNWFPSNHPLDGGDFQLYALQVKVAITERLTFIADRDGYATINSGALPSSNGWVNIGAGLRYLLVRDVPNQFLVSTGIHWEPQTGEADVFQSHGDGSFTVFGTVAKEFCGCSHFIGNAGIQVPVDRTDNSTFTYLSLHFDKQFMGWLYPLVELNWFHYTDGGNRGFPAAIGEGDGILNLGTTGVGGHDIVTAAVGVSAILSDHLTTGIAYETPLTNRSDLIDHRVIFELIFRF